MLLIVAGVGIVAGFGFIMSGRARLRKVTGTASLAGNEVKVDIALDDHQTEAIRALSERTDLLERHVRTLIDANVEVLQALTGDGGDSEQ